MRRVVGASQLLASTLVALAVAVWLVPQLTSGQRGPEPGRSMPYFDASGGTSLETWLDRDPEERTLILSYLVQCALGPDTQVGLQYRDTVRPLSSGDAGLGPSLLSGRLTPRDQERVSSCLLARVNAAGEHVQLDLIARYPGFEDPSEPDVFNAREAAYFGNLFARKVSAYVWLPAAHTVRGCTASGDCGVMQPTGRYAAQVYGRAVVDRRTQCYVGEDQLARRRRGSHALVPFDHCVIGRTGERYNNVMTVLLRGG